LRKHVNLWDNDEVERHILGADMTNGHRNNLQYAYMDWCTSQGFTYKPRRFKREEKLPYVPTEAELDILISGCGGRVRVFLQLLKESAFRPVEAFRLTPRDLDLVQRLCTLNRPAKNSRPRQFRMSMKLTAMITPVVQKRGLDESLFRGHMKTMRRNYTRRRNVLSEQLVNPRLRQVNFRTFRHWKATVTYHETKDILFVQRLLGHKSLKNTLVYTHLVDLDCDETYVVKVASTLEEFTSLLESGFEYIADYGEAKVLRKRK
jgi:integrase